MCRSMSCDHAWRRAIKRCRQDTFRVDPTQLDVWSTWFEPPTTDELE
jgi:hypothetical protein